MKIILSPLAEKQLRKITKIDQIAVAKKIRSIVLNKHIKAEKLQGYLDVFRVRVGSYRIVYKHFKDRIHIVLIGHRRDIYHLLKQLIK
ncbi:hypothetical protein A2690_00820 [Candidatus Roizmanbacteria bacterium RIFCSPHIGHO2_01_FULL_39_12b]|uniref:Addiction module toxin RelE n=1 Tax=Candidatus Roizmanbacteria bacterium RIFCSPHIGHO2_01_FULL_39_12b TaxID=1802030 RepID=A0A1F7GBN0_9BACT|nr:MAG: hypothetical protein A2690_00820 [Candidatus Roizmanbacteria bacterium RIFCSPHIGHO2_01_FULL_39_12b]OGK46959.1 MAG: hypothetical protein A3B46_03525 [Candidatus Roizmanbacteria bacterium RIFCSPLOWO2_01_FULL_39_19]